MRVGFLFVLFAGAIYRYVTGGIAYGIYIAPDFLLMIGVTGYLWFDESMKRHVDVDEDISGIDKEVDWIDK